MATNHNNDQTHPPSAGSASTGPNGEMTGTLGDFTLVRKIGAGAMGDVYLGRHGKTGEQVAIKLISDKHCLDEAFIKRFKREIAVLMGLDHPNIARAVGFGVDQDRSFLALEFIEGPNLSDVLHERGALFEQDVLTIAIHVARGLAHAYNEAGLVHRDIKPMNLLVKQGRPGKRGGNFMEEGDKVKIIDFGLAKPTDSDDQRLTMTGFVMGTPAYMSPEQIRCEASLDFHTDMYALGATMFHLLTGRIPYPGNAPAIIMTGHLTQPVPDPGELVRSLSQATRTIVTTAMAKQARGRYVDFRAMISACEKALKELSTAAPGTQRLLRKPLIRGGAAGEAKQPTPPQGEETMDFPALPTEKGVSRQEKGTGSHPRKQAPSITTSQMFKSPIAVGGADALEAKAPGVARKPVPASGDAGSEALRRILTDKIEKARTTSRIQKNENRMQALDLEIRRGLTPSSSGSPVSLSNLLAAYLPGLLLLLALVVLMVWFIFQDR